MPGKAYDKTVVLRYVMSRDKREATCALQVGNKNKQKGIDVLLRRVGWEFGFFRFGAVYKKDCACACVGGEKRSLEKSQRIMGKRRKEPLVSSEAT